jgi:hypothetical protein
METLTIVDRDTLDDDALIVRRGAVVGDGRFRKGGESWADGGAKMRQ